MLTMGIVFWLQIHRLVRAKRMYLFPDDASVFVAYAIVRRDRIQISYGYCFFCHIVLLVGMPPGKKLPGDDNDDFLCCYLIYTLQQRHKSTVPLVKVGIQNSVM